LDFELGTVVACDESGCAVRLVHSGETIRASFSEQVKDRIRIRQQQLVAVNTGTEPAEISWRWFIGEVEAIESDVVSIRRLDWEAGNTEQVTHAGTLAVAPGDLVFYTHGEDGVIVSHVADGIPADLASFEEHYLPAVVAFLTS
jgi:hypothetical protein